jgi:hypothetical protein
MQALRSDAGRADRPSAARQALFPSARPVQGLHTRQPYEFPLWGPGSARGVHGVPTGPCTPPVADPAPSGSDAYAHSALFLVRCAAEARMARGWHSSQTERIEATDRGGHYGHSSPQEAVAWVRGRTATMVLLVESEPREMTGPVRTLGGSTQDGVNGTKVETRIHQRQCKRCQRWFWAWDPARHECFVCDAPPPWELRRILGVIYGTPA